MPYYTRKSKGQIALEGIRDIVNIILKSKEAQKQQEQDEFFNAMKLMDIMGYQAGGTQLEGLKRFAGSLGTDVPTATKFTPTEEGEPPRVVPDVSQIPQIKIPAGLFGKELAGKPLFFFRKPTEEQTFERKAGLYGLTPEQKRYARFPGLKNMPQDKGQKDLTFEQYEKLTPEQKTEYDKYKRGIKKSPPKSITPYQQAQLKAGASDDAVKLIRDTHSEYAINPLGTEIPPSIPQSLIAQVADSLYQARLLASGIKPVTNKNPAVLQKYQPTDEEIKGKLGSYKNLSELKFDMEKYPGQFQGLDTDYIVNRVTKLGLLK